MPPQERRMNPEETLRLEDFKQHLRDLNFSKIDIFSITFAYQTGQEAHRGQMRISGEQYFEHLLATAYILIDECKIRDRSLIKAAFLHDIIEDTIRFGGPKTQSWEIRSRKAHKELAERFGRETAELVLSVSRPDVDEVQFHKKQETKLCYQSNLPKISKKAKILKAADRLHNTRTPYRGNEIKQLLKLHETRTVILPMLEAPLGEFQEAGNILKNELEKAGSELEQKLLIQVNDSPV